MFEFHLCKFPINFINVTLSTPQESKIPIFYLKRLDSFISYNFSYLNLSLNGKVFAEIFLTSVKFLTC